MNKRSISMRCLALVGGEFGKFGPENFPVLGQGSVDWTEVMRAARRSGRYCIIEDESADPAGQIPQSLTYLDSVRF